MFAISADRRTRVESGYRWQAHQIRLPYCARYRFQLWRKHRWTGTCATIAVSDNHRWCSRAFARHGSIGIAGPLCARINCPSHATCWCEQARANASSALLVKRARNRAYVSRSTKVLPAQTILEVDLGSCRRSRVREQFGRIKSTLGDNYISHFFMWSQDRNGLAWLDEESKLLGVELKSLRFTKVINKDYGKNTK